MRLLYCSLLSSFLLILFPLQLLADCAAPSKPGVRICAPSQNSTVVYIPALDFNSTPAFGAEIKVFKVYDNNAETVEGFPGQTGETIINAATQNGFHHVVINAWDTAGNLYQGSVSFTVIGDGYPPFCPAPSSPGVNFCEPPANAVLSVYYGVSATAKGNSSIAAMRLYVDNKVQGTQPNSNQFSTAANTVTQGNHKVTFVAWDTGGHVFTSTRTLYSSYTYSLVNCPPKGNDPCSPGFDTSFSPAPDSFVGNSFSLKEQILYNPNPITETKVYLDNKVVATSSGPMLMATVNNAPSGTHIVTLQAWDTKGILYRCQYNININMPH
jgi:hypothetical protein